MFWKLSLREQDLLRRPWKATVRFEDERDILSLIHKGLLERIGVDLVQTKSGEQHLLGLGSH